MFRRLAVVKRIASSTERESKQKNELCHPLKTNCAIHFTNHFQAPFFVRRASRVLPFFPACCPPNPSCGLFQTKLFGKPDYGSTCNSYLRSLEIAAFFFDGSGATGSAIDQLK